MQGLLRRTVLCFSFALSRPAGAQPADAPPPDTAHLRQGLAAALGSDFELVRTELHSGLRERGGIFWLAHVRPLRSGDYDLRYVHEYRNRVRPQDPLYTHVEHTTGFSVGEAGCARRAQGRTACLGDVIVIPVMAGDGRGPLGGHVFEARRRGDAGARQRLTEPAPEDERAATTPNPAAPHLRYLGARLDEMPHRSLGETVEVHALFEAAAPGALELSVGGVAVPVVIGSQYSTDVLLLQPGDQVALPVFAQTIRGRDFSVEEKEAFRRSPPGIAARPFRVDRERRFNAFITDHLPAIR